MKHYSVKVNNIEIARLVVSTLMNNEIPFVCSTQLKAGTLERLIRTDVKFSYELTVAIEYRGKLNNIIHACKDIAIETESATLFKGEVKR